MAITPLPPSPSRNDPTNFAQEADTFLGQLPLFGTECNALALEVQTNANVAISAAAAFQLPGYRGTSSTSTTFGTGSKSFTTQSNLLYVPGMAITISYTISPASYMQGTVTSYSAGTLVMNITSFNAAGTYNDWVITPTNLSFALKGANTDITSLDGVLVGRGAGAISGNTRYGASSLLVNSTGYHNTALGGNTLAGNTVGYHNTAIGSNALLVTSTGYYSTAVGSYALSANTTGYCSTAVGSYALSANTTGILNTAVGVEAMRYNTVGSYNTAHGALAMGNAGSGSSNTAIGYSALAVTADGRNTAIGSQSMLANTSGNRNVAIGDRTLLQSTYGDTNVAVGSDSLISNTTGDDNCAVGANSMYNCTTGNNNTAVGSGALSTLTTGSGNIAIGFINSANMGTPVFSITTQNDRISMGSTSVTNAYIQVGWTAVSDARDKTNFNTVPHGLEFVNALQPTAYQFMVSRDDATPNGPVRYGFKAQDILALEGENPVIIDNEDPEKLRYNESSMIPVLVKAIQELSAEIVALKAQLGGN